MKRLAAASLLSLSGGASLSAVNRRERVSAEAMDRSKVRALLMSATTLAGKGSMEHAHKHLRNTYGDVRDILLINFASLPEDRDAYEARMRRDFERIHRDFKVTSLHRTPVAEAPEVVGSAHAFFVSGGNTFLLLRELYERKVVDLLRDRVLAGAPYAGSSAGANIAGTVIGTTNDFPLTDIPTRRSLGVLPAVFNPHHPEESEKGEFASRQWKIGQYCRYHPEEIVIGVTNPGMIHIEGARCSLVGEDGSAYLQRAEEKVSVYSENGGDLAKAFDTLRSKNAKPPRR